ncbi:unnamed protein product [Orchesella dallaii]|uniref:AF4/FMR2 family member lilli n=1 Tax=Orchesella dallaii TaxID=48710 RepID=A0ABP1RYS7_9HEXA
MEEGNGYISVGGGGDKRPDLTLSLQTSSTGQPLLKDYCNSVDKEWMLYVNESKRLKELADEETEMITQVLLYLESTLYLVLTGVSMEQDPITFSKARTMYTETWTVFRDIVSRREFKEELKPLHAMILVLVIRCQSTLSFKLYNMKMKMPEVMNSIQSVYQHFVCYPVPPTAFISVVPCSSSGRPVEMTSIPVSLYSHMYKIIQPNRDLCAARDFWARADRLVEQYGIQDIFKQLDNQFGPLMYQSSLVDLVRYVQEGLRMVSTLSINSTNTGSEVPLEESRVELNHSTQF